jgi:hypothetical protein
MNLKEMGWEDMDWIHVAQDGDKFWAYVVINLTSHKVWGIFLAS